MYLYNCNLSINAIILEETLLVIDVAMSLILNALCIKSSYLYGLIGPHNCYPQFIINTIQIISLSESSISSPVYSFIRNQFITLYSAACGSTKHNPI